MVVVALGRVEGIWGAWQGGLARPQYMIGVYTDPDVVGGLRYIHESNGWDPTTATVSITRDFYGGGEETLTKTFTEWTRAINPGGEFADDAETAEDAPAPAKPVEKQKPKDLFDEFDD